MWLRSLSGYDFFISYRRATGTTEYVLRLHQQLLKRNYRCFVDSQEFEAGLEFERRLIRAARSSSILLLILTPETYGSKYVRLEVEAALAKRRRIVPITIARPFTADDWPELARQDPVWIEESQESVATGEPSAGVLDEIERSYQKPRLNVIRQRLLIMTVAMLSTLLLLTGYFWFRARKEAKIALARQLAAQSQLVSTEQPSRLERAALLGIESMRRHPFLEGDVALRNSARLLLPLRFRRDVGGFLRNVAVSPNGRVVAVSADDKLLLFDGAVKTELVRFIHGGMIQTIRFSPDGQFLVTASADGTARIIDIEKRAMLHELRHGGEVRTAVFSPDGLLVATASEDNTAAVWDVGTGLKVSSLPHPDWVEDVKFSSDGRYIATGSQDQIARVWSVNPPTLRKSVRFFRLERKDVRVMLKGTVRTQTVAFSPDGRRFAAGGLNGDVAVFDTQTWKELERSRHNTAISDLAFTLDSRALLTVPSGTVFVWDVRDGRPIAQLKHGGLIYDLKFSRDGTRLATASADQTARIWDTTNWSELSRVCAEDAVGSIAFVDDTDLITGGDSLRLWSTNASRKKQLFHPSDVGFVAFSPDGRTLATASRGGRVWSTRSRTFTDLWPDTNVRSIGFSANGRLLALASYRGEICIYDTASWQRMSKWKIHSDIVEALAFSPDSRFLVSGGRDGGAVVRDIVSNREVRRYEFGEWVQGLQFSPDGDLLAIAVNNGTTDSDDKLFVVNWKNGKTVAVAKMQYEPWALAWSPNGNLLAIGLQNGTIHIRDSRDWNHEVKVFGDQDVIRDLAFSKSGRLLLSGGADGTARIWETATWTEVSRLRLPSVVLGVAFAPDEKTMAASFNQMVQIDLVHSDDLIDDACSRVTRSLTNDEWKQYFVSEPFRQTCADLPRGRTNRLDH